MGFVALHMFAASVNILAGAGLLRRRLHINKRTRFMSG